MRRVRVLIGDARRYPVASIGVVDARPGLLRLNPEAVLGARHLGERRTTSPAWCGAAVDLAWTVPMVLYMGNAPEMRRR